MNETDKEFVTGVVHDARGISGGQWRVLPDNRTLLVVTGAVLEAEPRAMTVYIDPHTCFLWSAASVHDVTTLCLDPHKRWSSCETPPTGGLYRHYKGGLYQVLGLAPRADAEDASPLLLYRLADGSGPPWLRPLVSWQQCVGAARVSRFRSAMLEPIVLSA